jgi:hypothetical protein
MGLDVEHVRNVLEGRYRVEISTDKGKIEYLRTRFRFLAERAIRYLEKKRVRPNFYIWHKGEAGWQERGWQKEVPLINQLLQ